MNVKYTYLEMKKLFWKKKWIKFNTSKLRSDWDVSRSKWIYVLIFFIIIIITGNIIVQMKKAFLFQTIFRYTFDFFSYWKILLIYLSIITHIIPPPSILLDIYKFFRFDSIFNLNIFILFVQRFRIFLHICKINWIVIIKVYDNRNLEILLLKFYT